MFFWGFLFQMMEHWGGSLFQIIDHFGGPPPQKIAIKRHAGLPPPKSKGRIDSIIFSTGVWQSPHRKTALCAALLARAGLGSFAQN